MGANLPQQVSDETSQDFEDLGLVHRSQSGDTEAFGDLVTKYRAKIFSTIYCVVGNETDAWDLAQEGFLKAWRSIHRFQGRSSFYTWLYRITMNVTIDSLRRGCHYREVELDDAIPSSLPSPGVNYERAEIREQVYAALAQLTPEQRAVIVLKEIEDLHCQEIADILDISLGTVLSRLFYGKKKLQSILIPIFRPAEVESKKPRFSCDTAFAPSGRNADPERGRYPDRFNNGFLAVLSGSCAEGRHHHHHHKEGEMQKIGRTLDKVL